MTVARDALVEFWPLVDVGRVGLRPGDALLVRLLRPDPAVEAKLAEAMRDAFPDHLVVIVGEGSPEFVIHRAAREMRAEDLDQPRRITTME